MENKDLYKDTISNSKEESMQKALLILQENMEKEHSKIKRPDINVKKTILKIFGVILLEVILLIIGIYNFEKIYIFVLMLILILAIIMVTSKNIIINMILLYQRLASEELRESCLFEPTCSEYMILAIRKYGTIKGVYKGIRRLLRCHSPNGGIDYP